MKHLAVILLAVVMLFTVTACNGDPASSATIPLNSQTASSSAGGSASALAPTSTPTPVPTATEDIRITIEGAKYYPIEISAQLLSTLDQSQGVAPGESSESVSEIKTHLYDSAELEFVAYTQMRPEVVELFDGHLETLVSTLYSFCELEKEPVLDELTLYLLEALPSLPEEMQQDVYCVYKYRMIEAGIDGSLLRSGESLGLYYMAQTDEDWEDYPFPNPDSPNEVDDTIYDRACGVMSMTMVLSHYLHREVDPIELIDYVLENDYRITASGVDDTFMAVAAELYGIPEPEIYYDDPQDGQMALDWEYIRDAVVNNNAVAITHQSGRGNFTPAQHYMVLTDYVDIDGTGYFLVSDPFQSRRRYDEWGTSAMADPELGEIGVVYATSELLGENCSAVILFDADPDVWELVCASSGPVVLE